mmetsp:Transcript_29677/g.57057  ORF Transcript_29677/g.57057 Transcript_29677/m.57057 type:complete len:279 (-) Transcript_29677:254-1090(-)
MLPFVRGASVTDPAEALADLGNITENFAPLGDPWKDEMASLRNSLLSLYSQQRVVELWEAHTRFNPSTPPKHLLVTALRADLAYWNPLDAQDVLSRVANAANASPPTDLLLSPNFHWWQGGMNDRFWMGTAGGVRAALHRLEAASEYAKTARLHSETFLARTVQALGLEVQLLPDWFLFSRVRAHNCHTAEDVSRTMGANRTRPVFALKEAGVFDMAEAGKSWFQALHRSNAQASRRLPLHTIRGLRRRRGQGLATEHTNDTVSRMYVSDGVYVSESV